MGMLVLIRAARLASVDAKAGLGHVMPLGLVGGFLDAVGGGGWGPMVTSTLIGSGHTPRRVIGSVNVAEFFVTIVVATTFFVELGLAHGQHILALMIGGALAAPCGAYIVKRVQPTVLMALVGLLVSSLALIQLVKSFP
jgi:uncharacterized membrane protein YfcA